MRFILVDRILTLEPGKQITATKILPAEEELFRDHFPGFPVVPGVLLTEMMAQAAGRCLDAEQTHPGRAMLGKINRASFRDWVRPNQEIFIQAVITQNRRTYAMADCFAEVEGKKVCSAELFFAFATQVQVVPGHHDAVLQAYWKDHPDQEPRSLG